MRGRLLILLLNGFLVVAAEERRIIVVNEDNDRFFTQRAELMTVEGLERNVDAIAGGAVTHLFLCPSGQRTSYDSRVWDRVWDELELKRVHGTNDSFFVWASNAKLLYDKGIDPYQVWIRRCRERGISPWLSPRMNDAHGSHEQNPWRATRFWRERDDLHCHPGLRDRHWLNCTLDFSHDEVQDYTFALIDELLSRYDVDGLELDFMRFCEYFPADKALSSSHHLNRFVRRIKVRVDESVRQRGHEIHLGVRCPSTPKVAMSKGMDVGLWVREGWVDWVTASTYWQSPDLNMPVAEWRESFGTRRDETVLLNGTDHGVAANRGRLATKRLAMTAELYAGWADVVWASGADGLYLFNARYLPEELDKVCRQGLFPECLLKQVRRYPISFRSEVTRGVASDVQLPCWTDSNRRLVIRVGGTVNGRRVFVRVASRVEDGFDPEVFLNGVHAKSSRRAVMKGRCDSKPDRSYEYVCREYDFDPGAVMAGENIVTIGCEPVRHEIIWAEIVIEP